MSCLLSSACVGGKLHESKCAFVEVLDLLEVGMI